MAKRSCKKCHIRSTQHHTGMCKRCQATTLKHDDPEYRRNRKRVFAEETHCHECGELVHPNERSTDHIVPLSKGGTHARSNLALAHKSCNRYRNEAWKGGSAKKKAQRRTLPKSPSKSEPAESYWLG